MARITEMHRKWMEDPQYRKEYEALGEEFALAAAVIEARSRAGLTQQQLAKKMGTTQPAIARLESGRTPPSMRTLKKLAKATNTHLSIKLEPNKNNTSAA